MAAFDRVLSGIPEMDTAFDNIRLGDNVVWRVSDLAQFRLFMEPYVEQERKAGYNPELSYGSHIFQDLVEAEILYTAVFSDQKTIRFAPEKLQSCTDLIGGFEHGKELSEIVHVYDVSAGGCEVYNDAADEHLLITLG